MAKRKLEIKLHSYGIYTRWESASKDLPQITEFTTRVPAVIDIEFGFIVQLKGAKNALLDYCIFHPGIHDSEGNVRAPFDGSVYVKTNDWKFYLGDTIWDPISDKLGDWRMTVEMDGELIAEKTFEIFEDSV